VLTAGPLPLGTLRRVVKQTLAPQT